MLLVPTGAQAFGAVQRSTTARPAAAFGTSLTSATGSKGSWASIFTASSDSYGILININGNNASSLTRETVLDIGIDTAGGTSYTVRIPDLICGGAVAYTVAPGGLWYYFPLFIPAGAQVAARSQSTAAAAFRVYVQLFQRPPNPAMIRTGSFVEALGLGTLPSGTAIVPGTTAEGSWTLMGTTTKRLWWWQIGAQIAAGDTSTVNAIIHFDIAAGDGTNFQSIAEDVIFQTTTAESTGMQSLTVGMEYDIPSGTNIYARAQNSTGNETYNCTVYGMGG